MVQRWWIRLLLLLSVMRLPPALPAEVERCVITHQRAHCTRRPGALRFHHSAFRLETLYGAQRAALEPDIFGPYGAGCCCD